jgi:hypothetical protein
LDSFDIPNRRSVESFVEFTEQHPDWFETYHLGDEERVPLLNRANFYSSLIEQRFRYRPGDVVTILGYRDDERQHYHSFFVYSADPLTGFPNVLASNAGRPRLRSWENELASAPRRSIRTRIHLRTAWLESILAPEAPPVVEGDGS